MNIAGIEFTNPQLWVVAGFTAHFVWNVIIDGFESPIPWFSTIFASAFGSIVTFSQPQTVASALFVGYLTWLILTLRIISFARDRIRR